MKSGRWEQLLLQATDWECGTALPGMSAHITHQLSWQHELSLHQSRPFPPDAHQHNMSNQMCNVFMWFSTEAIKVEALLYIQVLCKAFPQESLPIHSFIHDTGSQISYFLIISLFSKLVLSANRKIASWQFPFDMISPILWVCPLFHKIWKHLKLFLSNPVQFAISFYSALQRVLLKL